MNDAIRALVGIHVSRLRRTLVATTVFVPVMAGLSVFRHGASIDSITPWLLGATLILPLAPAFSLIREKADGSLRYLASLPVRGADHALARTIVALFMSAPAALLIAVTLYLKAPGAGAFLAGTGLVGSLLVMMAASLTLLALQIKAKVGQAAAYVLYSFVGCVFLTQALAYAAKSGWLDGIRAILFTPAGLALVSAAIWVACLVAGWVSFRSIARTSVSYRGEPAEA